MEMGIGYDFFEAQLEALLDTDKIDVEKSIQN